MATNPIDALSVRVRRSGKRAALMAELQREEIVARIKQAREQAGMSQTEMGDALNVHWRTVQNYETIRVPFALLGRIAEVTGKTTEWLLHGDTPDVLGALNGDGMAKELADIKRELADIKRSQRSLLNELRALRKQLPPPATGRHRRAS